MNEFFYINHINKFIHITPIDIREFINLDNEREIMNGIEVLLEGELE